MYELQCVYSPEIGTAEHIYLNINYGTVMWTIPTFEIIEAICINSSRRVPCAGFVQGSTTISPISAAKYYYFCNFVLVMKDAGGTTGP